MLSSNPVDRVKMPPPAPPRNRRLEDGEFERLEEAAKQTKNPHIWPILVFAIETGMRRDEILGLRWEHVDLDRRIAFLPITKNGSSREVPLSTKAAQVLTAQRQRNDTSRHSLSSLMASGWRGTGSGDVLACLTFVSTIFVMKPSHASLSLDTTSQRLRLSQVTKTPGCSSGTRI